MQLTFESRYSVVTYILLSIGYWMIFKKFGKKPWLGLIPFARDYQLAVCADREEEGRLYVLFAGLLRVLLSASSFMESGSGLQALFTMFALIVLIPSIVYSIRILKPLCVIFDRSPRWIILWFFFESGMRELQNSAALQQRVTERTSRSISKSVQLFHISKSTFCLRIYI